MQFNLFQSDNKIYGQKGKFRNSTASTFAFIKSMIPSEYILHGTQYRLVSPRVSNKFCKGLRLHRYTKLPIFGNIWNVVDSLRDILCELFEPICMKKGKGKGCHEALCVL